MTSADHITDLGSLRANHSDNSPVRFLHSSDLHLGTANSALAAFSNLVDLALTRQVDFVVLGGDVYDTAERSAFAQLQFVHGLGRLSEAGIRVFIAHGNHDPVQASFTPVAPLPNGVYTFAAGVPQTFVLQIGTTRLAVTGVSFATQKEEENLVKKIGDTSVTADLRIAVVHANVAGLPGHDNYAGCTQQDLLNSNIHYWALGHIHDRTVTAMPPNRWWAYPGNLQGRSTKATECGPKGVLIVEAAQTGFARPEFVPCDTSRFLRIQADVTNTANLPAALDLIGQQAKSAIELDNPQALPTVLRISVRGTTVAHKHLLDLSNEGQLKSDLEARLPTHCSIKKVTLHTAVPYNRNQLASRSDVVGAVLTKLDQLRAEASNPGITSNSAITTDSALNKLIQDFSEMIGPEAARLVQDAVALQAISSEDFIDQVERLLLDGLVPNSDQEIDPSKGEVQL